MLPRRIGHIRQDFRPTEVSEETSDLVVLGGRVLKKPLGSSGELMESSQNVYLLRHKVHFNGAFFCYSICYSRH